MAKINAIKYFNAVNATLFTSGVFPLTWNRRVPAVSQLGETELKMEKAEGLLGGKFLFKRQNDETIVKTKVVRSICQAEFSDHRSSLSLLKLRTVKAELYYCDCVWPRSCIDGLVLVYSSPRVVRFAKQFPARTLGGVTLFVEDDLRDAFFVGVAVVVDCLFTFSQ